MKLGSNNRKVVIGVSALFALAVLMFLRMIWMNVGSTSAAPPAASSTTRPATGSKPSVAAAQHRGHLKGSDKKNAKAAGPQSPSLDPRLKLGLLELAENTDYAGTGRNIFQDQAEPVIPKPLDSGFKKPPVNTPPPAPVIPPPPPINLRYFGFANNSGSPVRKAFLSNGDDVFVAAEGEIVNRRYKILRINPTSIEIQDVLSNNTQSIPLSQG